MTTKITSPRRTIRVLKVSGKTGLSVSSIWRLVRQGQFPRPIKISPGCSAWIEDEVDDLIEAKRRERDAAPQCDQD
jgi:prophage regulatory protein